METIGIISLGCARNLVDSEVMVGSLKKKGYHIAHDPSLCDVIIVNTCGFIEASKKESIDTILEMTSLKKTGRLKKLVMAGCLSQRYSADLAEAMPEVDLFIGTGEFPKVAELLEQQERVVVGMPRALADEALPRTLATPRHYAYLKLAEGCQHACSFCIIPKLRGPLRSRSIDSLVAETTQWIKAGVKEFNLIAQDSTGYGRDRKDGASLLALMRALTKLEGPALNNVEGEKWFRLFYAYPHGFPMEVVDFMKAEPQFCNYLDLPIQHIDDTILKSMRREGTAKDIRKIIEAVRAKIPDVTLRTTLIVGYPGETDAQFKKLVDFIAEGHFDHVGVFTYSSEEGTTAARLSDDVSAKVKRERKQTLMQVQQRVSKERNQRRVGQTIKVLVDGPSKESEFVIAGRHQGQAPEVDGVVYVNECDLAPGAFVDVEILEAHEYDLVGRIVQSNF